MRFSSVRVFIFFLCPQLLRVTVFHFQVLTSLISIIWSFNWHCRYASEKRILIFKSLFFLKLVTNPLKSHVDKNEKNEIEVVICNSEYSIPVLISFIFNIFVYPQSTMLFCYAFICYKVNLIVLFNKIYILPFDKY